MILPDVMGPGLRVVFCGTAAGERSARLKSYYAGRGNAFWATLARVGLTPRELTPEEYAQVTSFGIGLTDISKSARGSDHQITITHQDVSAFATRISEFRPRVVAFNGKKAARLALGLKAGETLDYGGHHRRIAGVEVWVLPSTSAAARGHWDVNYWRQLAMRLAEG